MYFGTMKKLLFFGALIFSTGTFAQIKGLTDDGKEVVLFDNGTWRFVNESDQKTLETIKTNPTIFEKNKEATFLMKSQRLDVGIYFNPKKWKITTQKVSPFVEYFFTAENSDNSLYGFLMTEKLQISTLKDLKNIILESVQKRVDYFRLKESEYRTVNGLKVLYIQYSANTKGIDLEYAGYYYLDSDGYCGVVGFTQQKEFEKFLPQLKDFLNGISATQKLEVKEDSKYSSPPPPMETKSK